MNFHDARQDKTLFRTNPSGDHCVLSGVSRAADIRGRGKSGSSARKGARIAGSTHLTRKRIPPKEKPTETPTDNPPGTRSRQFCVASTVSDSADGNNSGSTLVSICTLVVSVILKLRWMARSPCPVAPLISKAAFHRLLPMPIS